MIQLSDHFELWEFTKSETAERLGIDNTPTPEQIENLRLLCFGFLEPIRAKFGPERVTSGFRSALLNPRIPGSSKTSAHLDGRAADFIPYAVLRGKLTLGAVFRWIAYESGLPFDQVIFEHTWIHLGIRTKSKPRGEILMKFAGSGYMPFDPNDPRTR